MISRPIDAADPEVSVVIPSMPSRDASRPVEALETQTFDGAYEVLVVSDEELAAVSRNDGLEAAEGDIVAYTDDDCVPNERWLESIVDVFDRDGVVCVEGPITGGIEYYGTREYLGGNIAVDRDAALNTEGWTALPEGSWREDTYFGWMMEEQGDCYYSDTIRVHHPDHARTVPSLENEQLLKERFPDRYQERIWSDSILSQIAFVNREFSLADLPEAFRKLR